MMVRRLLRKRGMGKRGLRGFTLVETMLALLIFVALTTIVAMGIPTAFNTYKNVVKASNAQIVLSTTTSALQNELGSAVDVNTVTGTTTVATYQGEGGYWYGIEAGDNQPNVVYYGYSSADAVGNQWTPADGMQISGSAASHPLIPEAAVESEGLKVQFDSITYDADAKTFAVSGLKVIDPGNGNAVLAQIEDESGNAKSLVIRAPFCS